MKFPIQSKLRKAYTQVLRILNRNFENFDCVHLLNETRFKDNLRNNCLKNLFKTTSKKAIIYLQENGYESWPPY